MKTHLSEIESLSTTVTAGTVIGKTGDTGGVGAHFHFDVNAQGITTSTVTGNITASMGQNPAAFFTTVTWKNKNPYGEAYSGYRDEEGSV